MTGEDDGMMPLDEALAVWVYLKDSPTSWSGPGAIALQRAHRTIRHYGERAYQRYATNDRPSSRGDA